MIIDIMANFRLTTGLAGIIVVILANLLDVSRGQNGSTSDPFITGPDTSYDTTHVSGTSLHPGGETTIVDTMTTPMNTPTEEQPTNSQILTTEPLTTPRDKSATEQPTTPFAATTQSLTTTEPLTTPSDQSTTEQPTNPTSQSLTTEHLTTPRVETATEQPTTSSATTQSLTIGPLTTPTDESATEQPTTSPVTTQSLTTEFLTTPTDESTTKQPTTPIATTQILTTEPLTTPRDESTTEQPTTSPATTQSLTTEPLTTPTDESATEQPTTSPVTTQSLTTEFLTTPTDESTTKQPTTPIATTQIMTTEPLTTPTDESTTEQVTTPFETTQILTTEPLITTPTDESATEQPTNPTTQGLTTEPLTTPRDESTTEQPTTSPATTQSLTTEPLTTPTDESATEQPTTPFTTTQILTTEPLTTPTDDSATEQSTNPTTQGLTTEPLTAPTEKSTTEQPTTPFETTQILTTEPLTAPTDESATEQPTTPFTTTQILTTEPLTTPTDDSATEQSTNLNPSTQSLTTVPLTLTTESLTLTTEPRSETTNPEQPTNAPFTLSLTTERTALTTEPPTSPTNEPTTMQMENRTSTISSTTAEPLNTSPNFSEEPTGPPVTAVISPKPTPSKPTEKPNTPKDEEPIFKNDPEKVILVELAISENSTNCLPDEDPASVACNGLKTKFQAEVEVLYNKIDGFLRVDVLELRKGSVIVRHNAVYNYTGMRPEDRDLPAVTVYDRTVAPAVEKGELGDLVLVSCVTCSLPEDQTNFCRYIKEDLAACQNPYLELQCVDDRYVSCRSPCKRAAVDSYCSGHGECTQAEAAGPVCRCLETAEAWYSGDRCDGFTSKTWLIVGVCVGSVVLIIAIVGGVCFFRKRSGRNNLFTRRRTKSYISDFDDGDSINMIECHSLNVLSGGIDGPASLQNGVGQEQEHYVEVENLKEATPTRLSEYTEDVPVVILTLEDENSQSKTLDPAKPDSTTTQTSLKYDLDTVYF